MCWNKRLHAVRLSDQRSLDKAFESTHLIGTVIVLVTILIVNRAESPPYPKMYLGP